MWSISGSYNGIDYVVRGDATTVQIDEPELTAFTLALARTDGVMSETVTGPHVAIDLTKPADVVRMLHGMTNVREVVNDGTIPPQPAQIRWSDQDSVVY